MRQRLTVRGREVRRRTVVALLALIVCAVVVALTSGRDAEASGRSPLARSIGGPVVTTKAGDTWTIGITREPGSTFTFGDIELVNRGSEPAALDEVQLIQPERGVRLVGALVATVRPPARFWGDLPAFPPPRELLYGVRVVGVSRASLPPSDETRSERRQLLVGLAVDRSARPGIVKVAGFHLRYRVGGREYVRRIDYRVAICVPGRTPDRVEECEDGWGLDEDAG